MASADRVTVLRQGKVTFTATRFEGFGADQLITHMMGTKILVQIEKRSVAGVTPITEAMCLVSFELSAQPRDDRRNCGGYREMDRRNYSLCCLVFAKFQEYSLHGLSMDGLNSST
jgi:hypothetical protein